MGDGFTPLIETRLDGMTCLSKLDFLMPTGSFKDRGTTVLVSALKAFGIKRVVEDSSGNAGASLAAYTARAGITAEIFVPAYASPAKLAQIRIYGVRLQPVQGMREDAARAAHRAATQGDAYYASHYYNPFVLAGMQTTAWEIWEQLGRRAPDAVFAPIGHGSNFIGIARGFQSLRDAGLIEKMPRLYAAQAANVAPIVHAFEQGLADAPGSAPARTIAEGIAINKPVRAKEILHVVRETGGRAIAVSEEEIIRARNDLARTGVYIEPTSATVIAAVRRLRNQISTDSVTVVTLTGSGLKASPV
jgi:threonine synthase